MDPKLLTPVLVSALLAWAIYRRIRRNVGRQLVNVRRLQLRIGLFLVIGALVSVAAVTDLMLLGGLLGGLVGGAALAYVALKHTVFDASGDKHFYTPHTYIGVFISALFLARVAFRILTPHVSTGADALSDQYPFAAYHRSPLTVAILGVFIGYYVVFYAGVIKSSRNPATRDAGTAGS